MVAAQELKNLSAPVYELDRAHHFQELLKNAYELKNLKAPIYMKDGGEHKFIPDKMATADIKNVNAPYRGSHIESKNVYVPDKPNPNSHPEPLMIGPRLPGVISKNQYIPQDDVFDIEKLMAPPTYRGFDISPNNNYYPDTERKPHEPPMAYPKLPNIEEAHKFNVVPPKPPGVTEQSYPVLSGIEIHNQYNLVEKRVTGQIVMAGPKYAGIETKNQYVPPAKREKHDKLMSYPVKPVETSHKYQPPLEKVPGILAMTSPVYRNASTIVRDKEGNPIKFCPQSERKETEKSFKAPIYTGIDAKSKYFPQAEEKPRPEESLTAPRYNVDSHNIFYPQDDKKAFEPPMVGPIYPNIETCNQYNPSTERVKGEIVRTGPKMSNIQENNLYTLVPERVHGVPIQASPVYHGVQIKNQYVPDLKRVKGVTVMAGPIYKGVIHETKYSHIPDKPDLPEKLTHPVLPSNRQHKYNPFEPRVELESGMLGPIYNCARDHHFREVISNALVLNEMVGGRIDLDMAQNNYSPESPIHHDIKGLLGPVYDILNEHHYNQINNVATDIRTLQYPFIIPEARHHFGEIGKNVEKLELLAGPVYNIKRDHCFREIFKSIDKIKKLQGPIYANTLGFPAHHFQAIQEHLETIKTLKGPIYDQEGIMKSQYVGIVEHVEALKSLQLPIYRFGEVGHKFEGGQILEPKAEEMKSLHGPKYDIDRQHQFSEIITQCNKLKDLAGPVYELGETAHHFSELKRHVESLKTLMGPIYVEEGVHK